MSARLTVFPRRPKSYAIPNLRSARQSRGLKKIWACHCSNVPNTVNREYRGIDKVTDVLSFPQFENMGEMPSDGEICLGDVVICDEKVRQQAEEYGHSYDRELVYLFVHSLLHLAGYDHMEEDEKTIMRTKEEEIMQQVDLRR